MIREILVAKPAKPGTSVAGACDFLVRTLRRKSLVFLISDFFSDPLDRPLGKLARKHETVALRVMDPLESKLPKAGKVVMIDPETGFETQVNTDNPNLRMGYQKLMRRQHEGVASVFKKHGIDSADLSHPRRHPRRAAPAAQTPQPQTLPLNTMSEKTTGFELMEPASPEALLPDSRIVAVARSPPPSPSPSALAVLFIRLENGNPPSIALAAIRNAAFAEAAAALGESPLATLPRDAAVQSLAHPAEISISRRQRSRAV